MSTPGGCSCVKSKCSARYCPCSKRGALCGPSCKCLNCENISSVNINSKSISKSASAGPRRTTSRTQAVVTVDPPFALNPSLPSPSSPTSSDSNIDDNYIDDIEILVRDVQVLVVKEVLKAARASKTFGPFRTLSLVSSFFRGLVLRECTKLSQ